MRAILYQEAVGATGVLKILKTDNGFVFSNPGNLQFSDVSIKGMDLKNEADRAIYEYICANVALGRLIKANLIIKVRRGRHFIYQLKN